MFCDSIVYTWNLKKAELVEAESRMAVIKDGVRGGEIGEMLIKGCCSKMNKFQGPNA